MAVAENTGPKPVALKVSGKARLHFGKLKQVESVYTRWFADIPFGTNPNIVEEGDYWTHYSRDLKPLDVIEAVAEDGAWELHLRVLYVDGQNIRLSRIGFAKHEEVEEVISETHYSAWKGPVRRWTVLRKEEEGMDTIIKDGFTNRDQAKKYILSQIEGLHR